MNLVHLAATEVGRDLSPTAFKTLAALRALNTYADTPFSLKSYRALARLGGISGWSAPRALRELSDVGLLTFEERPSGRIRVKLND